jgi:hypothetical protein
MANSGINIFGFEIKRKKEISADKMQSIVPAVDQDGAGYVTSASAHYGTYVNLGDHDDAKDNLQNIRQYRSVSAHAEVDAAIEDITNEAITANQNESPVNLVLDQC